MAQEDLAFADAFRIYLRWVEDGRKPPAEPRVRMLKAFREFLRASGIGPENTLHEQFVEKMEEFAKGVRGN